MRIGEDISGKGLWTAVDSWVERSEGEVGEGVEVGWYKQISWGFLKISMCTCKPGVEVVEQLRRW